MNLISILQRLSGLSPFVGADDYETMNNVSQANYSFDFASFDEISSLAKDFVSKLLVKEPEKRMRAKACLRHEWLIQLENTKPNPEIAETFDVALSLTKRKLKRYVILRR